MYTLFRRATRKHKLFKEPLNDCNFFLWGFRSSLLLRVINLVVFLVYKLLFVLVEILELSFVVRFLSDLLLGLNKVVQNKINVRHQVSREHVSEDLLDAFCLGSRHLRSTFIGRTLFFLLIVYGPKTPPCLHDKI